MRIAHPCTGAETPGFFNRGISDLAFMRIDVSSVLILFYLALTQSLLIKEQGGKWQKAALPLERNSILLEGYKTDFQGSNGVT